MDPQYIRDQNALQRRRNHLKRPELYLLTHAKRRARDAGVPFTITESDIKIPKRCPILGIQISLFHENRDQCASLDRIKPHLGYVPGNIAVMSFRANRLKSDATLREIEKLASWLRSVTE